MLEARKTPKVVAYLQRHGVDLVLLQETHLAPGSPMLTPRRMHGNILALGYTSHSRGVLIRVSRASGLHLQEVEKVPNGSYIVALCSNGTVMFLLVGIYGPNFDNPQFYYDLAAKAGGWGGYPQVWGGDFNCTLDPLLDRSGGAHRRPASAARVLKEIAEELGLVDIWRRRHPTQGGYTYYSAAHNLHTQIDLWLVSSSILGSLPIEIPWPRTYSDHSPVLVMMTLGTRRTNPFTRRFPQYSLLDSVFQGGLATAIQDCFRINIDSVDSMCTVWEAFKVYIRGITIEKHAGVLRSVRGRLDTLERELAQLEQTHLYTTDGLVLEAMHTKLEEFQDMAITEFQHMGKYATACVYGEGERPGMVLVNLICPSRGRDMITKVQAEDDKELTDPEQIVARFHEYYEGLYTSKIAPDLGVLTDYLSYIKLPSIGKSSWRL
ncbi:hypothetical protein NDU88_002920 [Pleurodeles waltl]|uniref:exodeoxyribonuclease III n=1 Tax=Pleurodeles waltl TaxID=8319 RepID=A0AAV7TPH3_PLEWA|nr:hypothetical protein NDU88_002920 [Pleurodeles waltl]